MTSNSKNSLQKEWLLVIAKAIIFAACAGGLTTLTHMICDRYVLHTHGAPDFLSQNLILFSAFSKILIAVGYYIFGRKIPVKNPILRSLAYIALNWISNFFPQFMGLAFADGSIAEQAFRISDLVCDSITHIIAGILLGILFYKVPDATLRKCNKQVYIKTIAVSAIAFPVIITATTQLIGILYPPFSCLSILEVSEQVKLPFYLNFYSWFILSGAFIAVFYRVTEYNTGEAWLSFGLKYSLLLWTPLVMIMFVFGTAFIPTVAYSLLFIAILLLLARIIGSMMSKGNR